MKQLYLLFCSIILSGLVAGCDLSNTNDNSGEDDNNGGQEKTAEELKAELVNRNWELRSVKKGLFGIFAPEVDTMYTFTFFENGRFKGKELCNVCEGGYEIDSLKNLAFTDFSCSEIACTGYQRVIDFRNTLVDRNNPFHFEDGWLYINVNSDGDEPEFFKFAQDTSLKEVIMANPANFDRSDWLDGPYHSLEADINKDTLTIELGYSGCAPHDLNFVFYDYFLGTNTVQANALITHKNEDCLAAFSSQEKFDLEPLKEEFQRRYGGSIGNIDIIIKREDETQAVLRYSF